MKAVGTFIVGRSDVPTENNIAISKVCWDKNLSRFKDRTIYIFHPSDPTSSVGQLQDVVGEARLSMIAGIVYAAATFYAYTIPARYRMSHLIDLGCTWLSEESHVEGDITIVDVAKLRHLVMMPRDMKVKWR